MLLLIHKYSHMQVEILEERAGKLEEEVRGLIDTTTEPLSLLEVIDKVHRFGLTYKFQHDINKALHRINVNSSDIYQGAEIEKSGSTLHATALAFRLLRQHGFEVSQGIIHTYIHTYSTCHMVLCMYFDVCFVFLN